MADLQETGEIIDGTSVVNQQKSTTQVEKDRHDDARPGRPAYNSIVQSRYDQNTRSGQTENRPDGLAPSNLQEAGIDSKFEDTRDRRDALEVQDRKRLYERYGDERYGRYAKGGPGPYKKDDFARDREPRANGQARDDRSKSDRYRDSRYGDTRERYDDARDITHVKDSNRSEWNQPQKGTTDTQAKAPYSTTKDSSTATIQSLGPVVKLKKQKITTLIEVIANNRTGDKVRVKCSPKDTVGDLKKLIAAKNGTDPSKIRLQKWYTALKDHISLQDYEVHDGMSLEMY